MSSQEKSKAECFCPEQAQEESVGNVPLFQSSSLTMETWRK